EHVTRAAHAAEQLVDPCQAAGREPAREPHRGAGQVCRIDLFGRQRPAEPDQRHSRHLEGRGGQARCAPGKQQRQSSGRWLAHDVRAAGR
nr:hypothetical protein [Tanacetum cinerariifolium]